MISKDFLTRLPPKAKEVPALSRQLNWHCGICIQKRSLNDDAAKCWLLIVNRQLGWQYQEAPFRCFLLRASFPILGRQHYSLRIFTLFGLDGVILNAFSLKGQDSRNWMRFVFNVESDVKFSKKLFICRLLGMSCTISMKSYASWIGSEFCRMIVAILNNVSSKFKQQEEIWNSITIPKRRKFKRIRYREEQN